ncbi:MAG TPA: PorV/PorQ family protein [Bacteroidota bacterium]|nr:PorV/PorQ family protein [Bacteroidota bacterium]
MRRRIIGWALAVVVGAGSLNAQNPNLGTSGGQFLKIPVGARAAALGGAFTSNADDASAVFWNPAGIVGVSNGALTVSHAEWWAGSRLSHAAYVQSFGGVGSFGLSFTMMSMDKTEVTTEEQPEGTGQYFDAQDLMLGISYARKLTEDFCVGITGKYVSQRIWNESATGFAVDIGTQYHIPFRDLRLGMSVTNFGGELTFDGRDLGVDYDVNSSIATERLLPAHLTPESFPLPLHFQVGLSMSPYISDDFSVLLATDVVHPNDNDELVCVGAEVAIMKSLFLRGGYRFGDDTARWSAGVGAVAGASPLQVSFDYAFVNYTLLPSVHRFSVGLQF